MSAPDKTKDMLGRQSLPPVHEALAVVMLEHTIPVDDQMIELVKSVGAGTNLIDKGEDIRKGSVTLTAGHHLKPQDLGLLVGLGIGEIDIYRQVTVEILSTGDDILPLKFKKDTKVGIVLNRMKNDKNFHEKVVGLGGYDLRDCDKVIYEQGKGV